MGIAAFIALAVLAGVLIVNAPARPEALRGGAVGQSTTSTQAPAPPPTSGQDDCGCGVPANPRGPR